MVLLCSVYLPCVIEKIVSFAYHDFCSCARSCFFLLTEHAELLLSLAATTSNITMHDACIAKLSVDIDRALWIPAIWENMSEEQLNCLLTID